MMASGSYVVIEDFAKPDECAGILKKMGMTCQAEATNE
jgi:hypothetical protein